MRPVGISIGDFNFRAIFYTQSAGSRNAYGDVTLDLGTGVNRWINIKSKPKTYVKDEGGLEYSMEFDITVRKEGLSVQAGDRVDFDNLQMIIVNVDRSDKIVYNIKAKVIEEQRTTEAGGIGSMIIGSTFIVA